MFKVQSINNVYVDVHGAYVPLWFGCLLSYYLVNQAKKGQRNQALRITIIVLNKDKNY